MTSGSPVVLSAQNLVVEYETGRGRVRSLDGASLEVRAGSVTAVVGESGSGKSTLGMAAGGLLAANARLISGRLIVGGIDPLTADSDQLAQLRRHTIGFVFQNPVAALDPTMRIRRQLALARSRSEPVDFRLALEGVGLADPERILASFPHEVSGGMAQRVGIAMALMRRPTILIADEPTAAVDATGREKILQLLVERCRTEGCALVLLTHDLHAVAKFADQVAVMYGGRVVEQGSATAVLTSPSHPYTQALLSALPGEEKPGQRLHAISGVPPVLTGASKGCAFFPRCPVAVPEGRDIRPPSVQVADGHTVLCHRAAGLLAEATTTDWLASE